MSAKAKQPAKSKPASKPKRPAPKPDWAGSKPGTQCARINAAISTKPRSFDTIVEQAKLSRRRVRSHLAYLIGEKLIVRTDAGFARKS